MRAGEARWTERCEDEGEIRMVRDGLWAGRRAEDFGRAEATARACHPHPKLCPKQIFGWASDAARGIARAEHVSGRCVA